MQSFGDISAARLTVRHYHLNEAGEPAKLRAALPYDGWQTAIVELCWERFRYCYSLYRSATAVFNSDLERRNSSAGYTFDAFPVRVSWGVGKMASLIKTSESLLNDLEQEIDRCRQRATFDTGGSYETLARMWLRNSRDLRSRAEYYLQASMWIQWTVESLWQADVIANHLLDEETHYFDQYGPEAFSYLAHPPLFVAVMAAASMVEEVGAFTIKELETGINPDMSETRLKEVLSWITTCDLVPDGVDMALLDEDLRSAWNDLAHSMMARSTTITIDTFERYVEAVREAITLTQNLAE